MKRISTSIVTVALACLGMAVEAKAANDRIFDAQIRPSETTTSDPVLYSVTVTNDIFIGPSHFIRQIIVTVPSVFTLVNLPPTTSPVSLPGNGLWKVLPI